LSRCFVLQWCLLTLRCISQKENIHVTFLLTDWYLLFYFRAHYGARARKGMTLKFFP
jgi:hypothetical protein